MTNQRGKWIVLAIITVIIVVVFAPYASSHPDGLERVAEDHQFNSKGSSGFAWSPFPDYEVGWPIGEKWRVAAAGLIGIGVMSALLWGIGSLLARKKYRRV